jgi:ABC-type branched-subunit amino acid transport system substrate-binding protein
MGIGDANGTSENAANISEEIFRVTGLHPDAYALSAFDAVLVMGLAVDLAQSADAEIIRGILPDVCGSYDYLGISRKLNEAGDMYSANYIFWAVTASTSGFSWNTYSTYLDDLDLIRLK